LRCLSILGVIWFHVIPKQTGLVGAGFLGVDLFFAISGFLITTLLVREWEANGRISLKAFYLRRTLRIFPLYYVVLAAYVVLTWKLERDAAAASRFWQDLPAFLTYTSNWFVNLHGDRNIFYFAWSLATEEQFYLFWPVTLKTSRSLLRAAMAMTAILLVAEAVRLGLANGVMLRSFLGWRILASIPAAICFGCLCALLVASKRGFEVVAPALARPESAVVLLVVLLAAIQFNVPGFVIAAVMATLATSCCVAGRHWLSPLLENRVVRHIGMVSYGMYLMHMLCFNVVRRTPLRGAPSVAQFFAEAALTIAVASLSYAFFERPILRFKDRVSAWLIRHYSTPSNTAGASRSATR